MDGFIIRVTAYHGEPVLLAGVHTRAGTSHDILVSGSDVVNDLTGDSTIDASGMGESGSRRTLDDVVNDFECAYDCKVNFGDEIDSMRDGTKVYEFDIFEPSYHVQSAAEEVMADLEERLTDFAHGK